MEETEKEGRFEYSEIYAYVKEGTYPSDYSKEEKRALRKRAKFFTVKGTTLNYIGGGKENAPPERLVVEDITQRKRIISSVHDSNHLGVNRTHDMVASKYYWPGLSNDIRAYVKSCEKCQRNNHKLQKASGSLHPIPVPPKIWSQVGMDLIGPMPETPQGNKYIVTLTDYFSKWAEAAPLKDKSALGVAKFIFSVMCRMGCPETIITDQGREFVNELSAALYAITNTDHRITSAYHPQTNGLTERFNQTISRCLAKMVNESQSDWDEKIDTVLMGYRASRQASTKHSPYFLLFHQQMRLPIDGEVLPSSCDEQEDEEEVDLDQKIQILLASREKAFKAVEANITAAQKCQKETYDRKHQPQVLLEGTEVLLENTHQKQRKGGKMEPLWLGPYVIHRDLGKGLYELKNAEGKLVKKKANINRLKIYTRRKESPAPPHSQSDETSIKQSEQKSTELTEKEPPSSSKISQPKRPPSGPTKSPPHKKRKTQTELWKKNLDLRARDKVVLRRGKLCDRHMYAANRLLATHFPHLQGLQSTLLSQTSFTPIEESGGFIPQAVQILHVVERDHWVCTSYRDGTVRLYDSVSTSSLTPSLEKQMAQLYRPAIRDGLIVVTVVPVQQQSGGTDCGVYSIAAAYNAALGENLSQVTYNPDKMRAHLEQCFEKEELSPFPPANKPVRRCKPKHLFIHVYCVCRLPESYDSKMIECEECERWFHFKCMELKSEPDTWVCPECSQGEQDTP